MNENSERTENTAAGLKPPPPVAGQLLDAQLHLLDRQVLDVAGEPVTAVDDLELSDIEYDAELDPHSPPVVTALLSGTLLGSRIFGGRIPPDRRLRIGWEHVADVGIVIRLGVSAEALDASWMERWLRERVVGRIPGAHHAPE